MSSLKTCFKCGVEKPLTEFYRHSGMGDGHLNKCKSCAKADVAANYATRRQQYAAYERDRYQEPVRRSYAQKIARERKNRNPLKARATYLTSNAIRDRRLVPQTCEVCGAVKVEAHHDDYNKPLEVRWLCRTHHLAHHGKVAYAEVLT